MHSAGFGAGLDLILQPKACTKGCTVHIGSASSHTYENTLTQFTLQPVMQDQSLLGSLNTCYIQEPGVSQASSRSVPTAIQHTKQ